MDEGREDIQVKIAWMEFHLTFAIHTSGNLPQWNVEMLIFTAKAFSSYKCVDKNTNYNGLLK